MSGFKKKYIIFWIFQEFSFANENSQLFKKLAPKENYIYDILKRFSLKFQIF
jgi:hypothetical protein